LSGAIVRSLQSNFKNNFQNKDFDCMARAKEQKQATVRLNSRHQRRVEGDAQGAEAGAVSCSNDGHLCDLNVDARCKCIGLAAPADNGCQCPDCGCIGAEAIAPKGGGGEADSGSRDTEEGTTNEPRPPRIPDDDDDAAAADKL
jgi:hypothetical protein